MSLFYWLQNWCLEHEQVKIEITTLDNPGWHLHITFPYLIPNMETKQLEISEDDWVSFKVKGNKLDYCGGAKNLSDILIMFRAFVEDEQVEKHRSHTIGRAIADYMKRIKGCHMEHWLENWYASHCDGYWEHGYGVRLCQMEDRSWQLKADITNMDVIPDEIPVHTLSGKGDTMVRIGVIGDDFVGEADADCLVSLLKEFQQFVKQYK